MQRLQALLASASLLVAVGFGIGSSLGSEAPSRLLQTARLALRDTTPPAASPSRATATADAPVIAASAVAIAAPKAAVETRAMVAESGTFLQEGISSYYGQELAGRPTASGERFVPSGLTAAHRTLPLGTRIRVTCVATGKSVIVRVNDRGPFVRSRVLDLSQGAAREIGLVARGHGRVRIEVLGREGRRPAPVEAPVPAPVEVEVDTVDADTTTTLG